MLLETTSSSHNRLLRDNRFQHDRSVIPVIPKYSSIVSSLPHNIYFLIYYQIGDLGSRGISQKWNVWKESYAITNMWYDNEPSGNWISLKIKIIQDSMIVTIVIVVTPKNSRNQASKIFLFLSISFCGSQTIHEMISWFSL